jgi:hypothetical protein
MPNDERLLGRLESSMTSLAAGQATMIADLSAHCKETADLHRAAASRTSEVESDIERVEAKVDGHADEDNKRFNTVRWIIGGLFGLAMTVVGASGLFQ